MKDLELVRLKKDDFHELVDLLNTVFTAQNGQEMDFEAVFPRIFVPEDETMGWHLGAKVGGKLCGVAASYPLTYRVGGTELKISAGGNVAVDAAMRGRGIMQSILNRLDEEDRAAGFDISYLHGDRFRYRNFGYERCGVECSFTLTRQMLGKDAPRRNFTYVNLCEAEKAFVKQVFDFFNTQKSCTIRDFASFMPAMKAKQRLPLAVLDESGTLIACFSVCPVNNTVGEIFVHDSQLFSDVVKGFMEQYGVSRLRLSLPAYDPLVSQAYDVADRYQIMQPGNFKIFNFKRVVESFMREKMQYTYLPDGVVTINSETLGSWSIEKQNETVSVLPYTGKAQYELPGYTVYPFLFGTLTPQVSTNRKEGELLKAWFPLPLYCPYLT